MNNPPCPSLVTDGALGKLGPEATKFPFSSGYERAAVRTIRPVAIPARMLPLPFNPMSSASNRFDYTRDTNTGTDFWYVALSQCDCDAIRFPAGDLTAHRALNLLLRFRYLCTY